MLNCSSKENGIYAIFCTINNWMYIGSASAKNGFRRRLQQHRAALRRGTHHSLKLQEDFIKYGEEVFEFIILEVCLGENCLTREQVWLDSFGVGQKNKSYNTCPFPGIAPSALGRKDTPETIAKRVASNKANPWPMDVKQRAIRLTAEANSKEYIVISPDGTEIAVKNMSEFCRTHQLCKTQMVRVAQGLAKLHRAWKCRYADETKEQYEVKLNNRMALIVDKRTRKYVATSPDGQCYQVENLSKFCREKGLCKKNLGLVAVGVYSQYKGWAIKPIEETEDIRQRRELVLKNRQRDYVKRDYIIILPDSSEIKIRGLEEFCRKWDLSASSMRKVANGLQMHHRNYVARYAGESEAERQSKVPPLKDNKKDYIVTNLQTGEETLIHGLKDFCVANRLLDSYMSRVAKGWVDSHRGYCCRYAD